MQCNIDRDVSIDSSRERGQGAIGQESCDTGVQKTSLKPPNGMAFSCRERAADHLQKPYDLAREAVNCNAVFGAPAWVV